MAEEEKANIRIYTFPHAGFIPGIPGIIPGGCQVKVNEDIPQVVAIAPLGQPFPDEAQPVAEPAQEVQAAPEQPQEQGAALPVESNALVDALGKLGGTN